MTKVKKYTKDSIEKFAMEILRQQYPRKYKNIYKSDRPDLMTPLNIGVEVTTDAPKEERELVNFIGETSQSFPKRLITKLTQMNIQLIKDDILGVVGYKYNFFHRNNIANIINIIDKKSNKLMKYQQCYETNLFIMQTKAIDILEQNQLITSLKKINSKDRKFKNYYLYGFADRTLQIIDTKKYNTKTIKIKQKLVEIAYQRAYGSDNPSILCL